MTTPNVEVITIVMHLLSEVTHVFVVRVWLELAASSGQHSHWRGVIENVATKEQKYFEDVTLMTDFVRSYLKIRSIDHTESQVTP